MSVLTQRFGFSQGCAGQEHYCDQSLDSRSLCALHHSWIHKYMSKTWSPAEARGTGRSVCRAEGGIIREGGPSWDASCIFREEPPHLTPSEATDEQPQINQEQILHTVLIRKAAVVSTGTLGRMAGVLACHTCSETRRCFWRLCRFL